MGNSSDNQKKIKMKILLTFFALSLHENSASEDHPNDMYLFSDFFKSLFPKVRVFSHKISIGFMRNRYSTLE